MKLPQPEIAPQYIGLYVVDFGGQCAIGHTATEVAELLESERHAHLKVFKIHRPIPMAPRASRRAPR